MKGIPRLLVCTETYPPQGTGSSVTVRHLLAGTVPHAAYLVATAAPGAVPLPGRDVVSRDLPGFLYRRDLRVGLSDFVRILSRPVLFKAFFAAARAFRPDAVFAVFPSDRFLILGDRLARALDIPLLVHFHNLWEEALRYTAAHGGFASDRARFRIAVNEEAAIVRRSAMRFALTDPMARFLAEKHRVPFSCLPHAFPPRPSMPRADGDGTPADGLDLLVPGALYGMHVSSLRALTEVVETRRDVRLTVTAGQRRDRLASMGVVASARVALSHYPAEEEFLRRLARADACAVCLARTGYSPEDVATALPTRVVESLRFGRPILAVAPRESFLFRFVRENGVGIAADPETPGDIAAALDAILSGERRREFSENAARAFAERFSVERIGPAWIAELASRLQR